MATTLRREACQYCNSSNNVCFWEYKGKEYSKCTTPDCDYNKQYNKNTSNNITSNGSTISQETTLITSGIFSNILERGISEDACKLFNYQIGTFGNKKVHIANYFNDLGQICAQKIRFLETKQFIWQGNSKDHLLFGQQFVSQLRQRVWITEGEIDALSLHEAFKLDPSSTHSDTIVSISTGAGDQTLSEINKHKEWLETFEKIIFCFDSDKIGQETVQKVAKILDNKKTYNVCLTLKDANEFIKQNKHQQLYNETFNYKKIVPKSIVKPTFDEVMTPDPVGWELPYPLLNEYIRGIKKSRLITILAGPKTGKSTITREIAKHLLDNNQDVKTGFIYLEEPLKTTAQAIMAMELNIPHFKFSEDPYKINEQDAAKAYEKYVKSSKIEYIDASFMKNLDGNELIYNMKFMIEVLNCNIIILDHLTMITYDSQGENSERKDIDVLMKNLRRLVNETGATIITICHLSKPKFGKSWEEGREVTSGDARGSAAIAQLSDIMIGLERNLHNSIESDKMKIRVLMNRITGKTGYVDDLYYVEETGRYVTTGNLFK